MRRSGFLAVCAALLIGGCGFQMRGGWQLPASMENTVLSGGTDTLYGYLRKEFLSASARLSRRRDDGVRGARLLITRDEMGKRRVLSVDNRGKAVEYEIHYVVSFKVVDADGNLIVSPQLINMTRDYLFVAADVVGAERENALLREQLYRDMVGQIMRRIWAMVR